MYNLFYYFVLFIFSIYVLLKTIAYAKYEKDSQNNKSGAIVLLLFSTISILLCNYYVLLDQ